ncbi:MAG: hypothetical protein ACYCOU_17325 [Sulfobacillus sp.]
MHELEDTVRTLAEVVAARLNSIRRLCYELGNDALPRAAECRECHRSQVRSLAAQRGSSTTPRGVRQRARAVRNGVFVCEAEGEFAGILEEFRRRRALIPGSLEESTVSEVVRSAWRAGPDELYRRLFPDFSSIRNFKELMGWHEHMNYRDVLPDRHPGRVVHCQWVPYV